MDFWSWETCASVGVEAIPITLGIAYYLLNRRARRRRRKARYAAMLHAELAAMRRVVQEFQGGDGYYDGEPAPLPQKVYDGLVSSAKISRFDIIIQKSIHHLYRRVARYNHSFPAELVNDIGGIEGFLDELGGTIYQIDQIRIHNSPGRLWRRTLTRIGL